VKELRFALIGCGDIGPTNVASLSAAPGCRLVRIADVNPEALSSLPPTCQDLGTTDVAATLASPEVDAVFVATPHHLHAALVAQAASQGKHVVVEKPMACTLEEADDMMARCQKAKVALSVCHPRRYDALVELGRQMLTGGRIGSPHLVFTSFFRGKGPSYWVGGNSGRVRSAWRQSKRASGGGVLMMNGVHQLDTLLAVSGGKVRRIQAEIRNLGSPAEVEDTAVVTLHFEDGLLGILQDVTLPAVVHQIEDRWIGSKGEMILRPKELEWHGVEAAGPKIEIHRRSLPGSNALDESKRRFFEAFAAAVGRGEPPPVRAEYGREILQIVLAAYGAAEQKHVLEI
jgi:UDP-N-acetyl-2-amino-2-deoxyglucuronate dehydrogenase